MKKILIIVSIVMLMFSACKTSKKATPPVYEPAVEISENEIVEPVQEIVMKEEEVTVEKSDDLKLYPYYVIIGSFSIIENAYKLQDQQMAKGVSAVVLKSETGMMRVAYLGTDSEQDARNSIGQIRKGKKFPDAWLLKTK